MFDKRAVMLLLKEMEARHAHYVESFPLEPHHTFRLSHNCFCLLRVFVGRISCSHRPRAKVQVIGNHRRPITRRRSSTFQIVDGFSGGHRRGSCTYNLLHVFAAVRELEYLNPVQWQAV